MQRAKSNWLTFFLLIIATSAVLFAGVGCGNSRDNVTVVKKETDIIVQAENEFFYAGEGLDMEAVGVLFSEVGSAEELQNRLNEEGGINNLDLNEDDITDNIRVTEFPGDNEVERGLSLVAYWCDGVVNDQGECEGKGGEHTIGTIFVVQSGDGYDVEVHGDERVYGDNHYYYNNYTNLPMGAYMYDPFWTPFVVVHPFGYYPRHRVVSVTTYKTTVTKTISNSSTRMTKAPPNRRSNISATTKNKNPNKDKIGNVKAPIKNPTTSQKSFQAQNPSKRGVPEKKGFSSQNKNQSGSGTNNSRQNSSGSSQNKSGSGSRGSGSSNRGGK